ncbi:unnamed protein product [Amoebophrya sp. A120]|nr:unnamed protein product [Amoebophrya sp. A120]|eukprot:GSA120T00003136001.1
MLTVRKPTPLPLLAARALLHQCGVTISLFVLAAFAIPIATPPTTKNVAFATVPPRRTSGSATKTKNWCEALDGSGQRMSPVDVSSTKFTTEATGAKSFSFKALRDKNLSVILTPLSPLADPDVSLYGANTGKGACKFVQRAVDYGQDVLRLPQALTVENDYDTYFIHVQCRGIFAAFSSGAGARGSTRKRTTTSVSSKATEDKRRPGGRRRRGLMDYFFSSRETEEDFMAAPAVRVPLQESGDDKRRSLSAASKSSPACKYHLSVTVQTFADELQGTKTGVAYLGVSQNFLWNKPKGTSASSQLTLSVFPRDAIAVQHGGLKLLVNDQETASTKARGSFRAQHGWFGGEVVKVSLVNTLERLYISVLKRQKTAPVPFVLTAKLNDGTPVKLIPHAPVWALVQRRQTDYYTFEVTQPKVDIGLYVTPVSGDPGLMCEPGVDARPLPGHALWEEHHPGGESLFIVSNDPKRKQANIPATGNFTVGVYGAETAVYSLMVILDPHVEEGSELGKLDVALGPQPLWGELYFGFQQRLSVKKQHTGHLLFFNALERSHLDFQVTTTKQVDVCVTKCGPDPHNCAERSPLAKEHNPDRQFGSGESEEADEDTTKTTPPRLHQLAETPSSAGAISNPEYAKYYSGEELTPTGRNVSLALCATTIRRDDDSGAGSLTRHGLLRNPCPQCWYAVLVSSKDTQSPSVDFTMTLSASGSEWHPLTLQEPFWGHVDVGGADVKLSLEITKEELAESSDRTLQFELVPLYGNAEMKISELDTASLDAIDEDENEDSESSASSSTTSAKKPEKVLVERTDANFETTPPTDVNKLQYRLRVKAKGREHAQFRVAVRRKATSSSSASSGDSESRAFSWADVPLVSVGEQKPGFVRDGAPEYFAFVLDGAKSDSVAVTTEPPLPMAIEPVADFTALKESASSTGSTVTEGKHKRPDLTSSPWRTTKSTSGTTTEDSVDLFSGGLAIKPEDEKYNKSGEMYYVVGVFPPANTETSDSGTTKTNRGYRFQLQIRSFKEMALNELLPDQPPVRGSLQKDHTVRYALKIGPPAAGAKHRRHIVLSLVVFSGDADLYAGFTKSVSKSHHTFGSSRFGSDAIFITGFSDQNKCAEKFKNGNPCTVYIIVYGYSKDTRYALSATTPDGKPTEILPDSQLEGSLQKGLRQFYYTHFMAENSAAASSTVGRITIVPQKGDPDLYCVVSDLETAKNPPSEFADLKHLRRGGGHKKFASYKASGTEMIRIPFTECSKKLTGGSASPRILGGGEDANGLVVSSALDPRPKSAWWDWRMTPAMAGTTSGMLSRRASASDNSGGADSDCAIFCAVYAFSNTTFQVSFSTEQGSGSSSSSSSSSSSQGATSSTGNKHHPTNGPRGTVITPNSPSVGMLIKRAHELEVFYFNAAESNALLRITPFMDCHLVTTVKEREYNGKQIALTGLNSGETVRIEVRRAPNYEAESICMFEVDLAFGTPTAPSSGGSSGTTSGSSSRDSSLETKNSPGSAASSPKAAAKANAALFPTIYTENDTYKKAKLSRLTNGIPFIGSTAVGRGFEEQRFVYSPQDCEATEVRITPFSGDLLVFRKKPGSYNPTDRTEVWYNVPRGRIDDGTAPSRTEGAHDNASHTKTTEQEDTNNAGASGGDAVTANIAASKNQLLEYYILKPGPAGCSEEMKFLVRRIHGVMASDYSVTAFEDGRDRPRFETLPTDVPAYMQFPGKTRRFSLFVNSAVTKQTLRLQCRPSCIGMEVSAGMSPDDGAERVWKANAVATSSADGSGSSSSSATTGDKSADAAQQVDLIELSLKDPEKAKNYGFYPRVVYAWVTQKGDDSHGILVHASLVATSDSDFGLLLDGGEAQIAVVRSQQPAYFAFDSRRASPLLTIIAKLPYDEKNDLYNTRNRLWVQNCLSQDTHESAPLPSAEHHDTEGKLNSRNQLVAFVDNSRLPTTSNGKQLTGKHCIYRIAVETSRPTPVRVSIRGGTTRKNAPLRVNGPSQIGIVREGFPESYILSNHVTIAELEKKILVHYEPCIGKLKPARPPIHEVPGDSDTPITVACEGKECHGRFLLRATSFDNSWEYRPGKLETPTKGWRHGTYTLSWTSPRKRHYQSKEADTEAFANLVGDDVWYELFIIPVSDKAQVFDLFHATPCGVYNMLGKLAGVQRKMFRQDELTKTKIQGDNGDEEKITATVTAHYAPTRGEHFEFVLLARDGQTDEKFAYTKTSLSDADSEGTGDYTGDPSVSTAGDSMFGASTGALVQQYSFFSRLSWVLFVGFVIISSLVGLAKYGPKIAGYFGFGPNVQYGRTTAFELRPHSSPVDAHSYYEPPNAIGVGYNRIE